MSHPVIAETEPVSIDRQSEPVGKDRGLLLIGLFKLAKSVFFFFVGIGALHLLHKDLGDESCALPLLCASIRKATSSTS